MTACATRAARTCRLRSQSNGAQVSLSAGRISSSTPSRAWRTASFAPVSIGGPDVWPASSMQADRYAAACRLSPITQADRIFPVGNIDPSWFNSIFPDYILAGIAEAPDKIAIDPLAGLTRTLK